MKRSEVIFGLLRIPSDAVAVTMALLLAYFLRMHNIDLIPWLQVLEPAQTLPSFTEYCRLFLLPCIILFLFIAALLKLYLIRMTLSAFREEQRILLATIVWVGLIMGWFFFVQKQLFYSRMLLIHATLFVAMLVSAGRMKLTICQRLLLKRGIGVRTVLSIGTLPLPEAVKKFLQHDHRYRYAGHLPKKLTTHDYQLLSAPSAWLGAGSARIQAGTTVDLILQTDPNTSEETNELIDFCRSHHIGYAFLPPVLVDVPHLLTVHRFGSVPVLRFRPTPLDGWGAVLKRSLDMIVAGILLIILSPFFLLFALLIKLETYGNVFYRSRRIGQGGNFPVTLFKFRSMVANADELKERLKNENHRADGPLFKLKIDPRVTHFGKFLRRFSLDELPQLWNVLRGDLSLVGPRPHLPEEVAHYTDFQKRVFAVKPGLTGLAQISGRSDLSFAEEVRLDLRYVEEWSLWLDLWILWRTIGVVLKGEGAD